MKSAKTSRRSRPSKRSQFDAHSSVYPLSVAKAFLGRLTDKARRGEPVYIVHGRDRFLLQPLEEIEPIPMRPAGYFQLDQDDLDLDRRFASANVVPSPNRE